MNINSKWDLVLKEEFEKDYFKNNFVQNILNPENKTR